MDTEVKRQNPVVKRLINFVLDSSHFMDHVAR
jgi:hypothetical protein